MAKPILFDLYSGAGGASAGYQRAGFDVVGGDLMPQKHYPFPFIQADALQLLADLLDGKTITFSDGRRLSLKDIAAFAASPPCQAHSDLMFIHKNYDDHLDMIPETRAGLEATGAGHQAPPF